MQINKKGFIFLLFLYLSITIISAQNYSGVVLNRAQKDETETVSAKKIRKDEEKLKKEYEKRREEVLEHRYSIQDASTKQMIDKSRAESKTLSDKNAKSIFDKREREAWKGAVEKRSRVAAGNRKKNFVGDFLDKKERDDKIKKEKNSSNFFNDIITDYQKQRHIKKQNSGSNLFNDVITNYQQKKRIKKPDRGPSFLHKSKINSKKRRIVRKNAPKKSIFGSLFNKNSKKSIPKQKHK